MKKRQGRGRTNPQECRLPYGKRVVITSEVNSFGLPLGATGTIVKRKHEPVQCPIKTGSKNDASKVNYDYFWENWEEQFVQVDGDDERPIQVRRWRMAPIEECETGGSQ